MSISLVSATPVASNVVRVAFSEAFTQDSNLYEKSNYTFRVRYGPIIDIYAKSVDIVAPSIIDINLQDAMMDGGQYAVAVHRVSAISDGIPIEDGGGTNELSFDGVGDCLKCFAVRKRLPPWLNTRYGSTLHAVLCAVGCLTERTAGWEVTSEISQVTRALLLRTAEGADLGIIGQNFGVERPQFLLSDDNLYRKLIPIFATKRKAALSIFYDALSAVFGPPSVGWWLYTITPNILTVELAPDLYFGLAPGTLDSATYFHDGDSGTSTSVGPGYLADTTKAWEPNYWVNALLVDSTATEFLISSNTATQLTVTGTPAAGTYTILEQLAFTYPGDYFLEDSSILGSTIDGYIIVLFQQTVIDDIITKLKASGIEIVISVIGE